MVDYWHFFYYNINYNKNNKIWEVYFMKYLRSIFTLVLAIGFATFGTVIAGAEENNALNNEEEFSLYDINSLFTPKVIGTELVDDLYITKFEELPDEFIINGTFNNNNDNSPQCATCIHSKLTKVSERIISNDYRFGWHPDFSGYERASGYWFSSGSQTSFSVGLAYGMVSVSISKAGGSGYYVNANYNKRSRPAVYGVYKVVKYKVEEFNSMGRLIRTFYQETPFAEDTYVKIEYK